ncbi:MAG TPA: aminoacyl-tRNA hydrolase [Xanthomonadales bacterium]|nr:aminoacyl-tRNA hydrolase [Xanthomonadales bacterium]
MTDLFIIAGLGNPGPKYSETRHNAGFWFLDALARSEGISFRSQSKLEAETARLNLHGKECLLVKPETYMNHSGQAIRAVTDYFQASDDELMVAYDELDLPAGTCRLKSGGGHGGHNGMRDIFRHIPSPDFLRLRIGIGHPGFKDAVTAYVLSRPSSSEESAIRKSITQAISVLPDVLGAQLPRAMKSLHTQDPEN